jgi:hypothetical protein
MSALLTGALAAALVAPVCDDRPRLAGAANRLPDAVRETAPFDVAAFLAEPAEASNAEPLYLDAFFEFDPGVAVCFPEGPERERRETIARTREGELRQTTLSLENRLRGDEEVPPLAEIDRILAECDDGFRKLREAQRRPACVFRAGFTSGDLFPAHLAASRQVRYAAEARITRAIARGQIDRAIDHLEVLLRLARDLRPRAPTFGQMVACELENYVAETAVLQILNSPGLGRAHCDRLVRLLAKARDRSTSILGAAAKADYLITRQMLVEVLNKPQGYWEEQAAKRIGPVLAAMEDLTGSDLGSGTFDADIAALEEAAAMYRREGAQVWIAALDRWFAEAGRIADEPVRRQMEEMPRLKRAIAATDPFLRLFLPDQGSLPEMAARRDTGLGAAACLAALRRYELVHGVTAPGLGPACDEAGIGMVPLDPFGEGPLKLARIESRLTVYSVGRDGVDDRGCVDSDFNQKPGDLLYPLPGLPIP